MHLRHYFTHYTRLGGVQSILAVHLERDPRAGWESSLLAFFDPAGPSPRHPGASGLGLTGWDTIRSTRRKLRRLPRLSRPMVPIYHDLWGLAFLGDQDEPARRRLGAVHSQWPLLDHQLDRLEGSLDGVFTDSEAIAERVRARWPGLDPERIRHLPVPARIGPEERFNRSPPGPEPVVGYVGRVTLPQKRVDRLPPLLDALHREGIPCRLEILGDGDAMGLLASRFPSGAPVRFLGRREGEEYWKALGRWDFVISTSDHEGSPLSLVEAMSLGAIPVFPRIGSGGDALVTELDPGLVYSPEGWREAASIVRSRLALPPSAWQASREACRKLSLRHSPGSYHRLFVRFLDRILELPRVSGRFGGRRPWWRASDRLPYGLLSRFLPRGFHSSSPIAPPPEEGSGLSV